MLTRRAFLQVSAAASASAYLGCSPRRTASIPGAGPPAPVSVLHGSRAELDEDLQLLSGQLPVDLDGHALIVGAIPYGDGTPLFTGDGMVYRLSFEPNRARLKTRLLRTDDFRLDEAAAAMPSLAFQSQGFTRMSPAFGSRDFVNTALVPLGDRLIACYDAGRPWELDPVSLDPLTAVGLQSSWQPMLPPVTPGLGFFPINMATAHPCWDADDAKLYLVNYAPPFAGINIDPFVRVMVWDGRSEPTSTALVDEQGMPARLLQSCHQMNVTRNWIILSDGAFAIDPSGASGNKVKPQLPYSIFWFIRKSDLGKPQALARRVQIDLESAHFLVDRDDSNDRITLHVPHLNSSDPAEWMRSGDTLFGSGRAADPALAGMIVAPFDLGPMARYTVDASSGQVVAGRTRLAVDPRMWATTLWTRDERAPRDTMGTAWWTALGFIPDLLPQRIADAYLDRGLRIVPVGELPKQATPGQLFRFDHDAGTIGESFAMPIGTLPMSPTFVPRKNGGRDEGYLVTLTCGPEADEVWIFDASSLAAGPLCRLGHPRFNIGFSLHTTWMGDLRPSAGSGYRVSPTDDYGERVTKLSSDAQALAKQVLGI